LPAEELISKLFLMIVVKSSPIKVFSGLVEILQPRTMIIIFCRGSDLSKGRKFFILFCSFC